GGGLGIAYVESDRPPSITEFTASLLERLAHAWQLHELDLPEVILEPGRSLVGRAGVTLYRVGVVKRATETTTFVAVDGGMYYNPVPRPAAVLVADGVARLIRRRESLDDLLRYEEASS